MPEPTGSMADEQEPLEATIKDEVLRMYQEVADHPENDFHFYHGREAADAELGRGLWREVGNDDGAQGVASPSDTLSGFHKSWK